MDMNPPEHLTRREILYLSYDTSYLYTHPVSRVRVWVKQKFAYDN